MERLQPCLFPFDCLLLSAVRLLVIFGSCVRASPGEFRQCRRLAAGLLVDTRGVRPAWMVARRQELEELALGRGVSAAQVGGSTAWPMSDLPLLLSGPAS